jgi:phage terminase large subunit-like protein
MSKRAEELAGMLLPSGDGELNLGADSSTEDLASQLSSSNSSPAAGLVAQQRLERDGYSEPESASELVQTLLRRERARTDLISFAQFVDPNYEPYPVHRLIARKLEDIEAGRIRRLAIFIPPASGKSRLASELFPAWFFGRNPRLEFIQASYDHDLARGFGRNVRNLIKHPSFQLLFPEAQLSPDATAMDEWKLAAGGEYKAEGVGGGLIGFHAHVAVIDDPIKNWEQASSAEHRELVWNWFGSVLLNRLRSYKDGYGSVVLILQRWHDDDIGGRIEKLTKSGEEVWDIISLPSIAEENDPLERAPGEPLLPDGPNRRSLEELYSLRAKGSKLFMALHQQKPVSDDGDMFKPGWVQLYSPSELPSDLVVYMSSDFAMSENEGDYSVLCVAGVCSSGHLWLLDLWRKQCGYEEAVTRTVDLMLQWKPRKFFLEKTSMARVFRPLIDKLRKERKAWTVVEEVSVIGRGKKDSPDRAGAIAGAMQLGYVHAPMTCSWLGDFLHELSLFPGGKHDDQVDMLALFGIQLDSLTGKGKLKLVEKSAPVEPVIFTFNDIVDMNRRRRMGQRVTRGAMVLPTLPPSALDDPEEALVA